MKRFLTLIILFICLLQSSLAFSNQSINFNISGVSEPLRKNILDRLTALQQSYGTELNVTDIQALYKNAPANIRSALEPFGYFKAEIKKQQLVYRDNQWHLNFSILPGPILFITAVETTLSGPGQDDPELQKLLAHFPLQSGQPFQTEAYEKAKDILFMTANNQGYLQAVLTKKEVRIDLSSYTASIILHMNTGPRFYFGPILFSSNPFSTEFLQRFVAFKPGEPFSSKTLLKLQEDLSKSHYFEQVIVTPDIKTAENYRVPIHVFLTVPKAKQYNVGVGYGTFTGPRLTLGADYRRVGSNGQHFTVQMKASSVLSGLAAKYFIPGKNPLTDQYTLGADAQKFSPKNGQSFSETFSASYIKNLNDWQHNFTLNYLIERFQVNNDPSEVSRLLYPSYALSRIKMDNLIYPRFGSAINFTLQGASRNVLASTSFIQSEIKGKYIFSPTSASRVILRGDLGYTVVNDLSRLPLTLRYFAGGLGSVRGYGYSSIGPGRYLKTASIEYQHQIYGNFSGAVFYDVGTATNHFNDVLQRGEGVGVVYNSILGPVQVYLARAMNKRGKPFALELSIGPDL